MEEDDDAFVGNTHMSRRVPSSGNVKKMDSDTSDDSDNHQDEFLRRNTT